MLYRRVNDHDMPYIEIGHGAPLVCIHGSLCDFRVWGPVLGPLSQRHRVIAVSLRRFFPECWDGTGGGFTIDQHVADVIAFIEAMAVPNVHLMGHSRGGHIAFRVAQQRPDLLGRVVLAEPGGDLDASLLPAGATPSPALRTHVVDAAERIAAGDVDGGLALFIDRIDGAGAWRKLPPAARQELRDNARTLLGQVNEQRRPYTRADAEAIRVPMLFVGGADTVGSLPVVLRALASHVPGAWMAILPHTTHVMFEQSPVQFCTQVLKFLEGR